MTSQILAIFYLNDMDHFIKNTLKIKGVIRYQDDFLLFHQSKDYLKYCLHELEVFLESEDLKMNKKTRIFKNTDNFIFIGRNKYGNYSKYRTIKRRLKYKKHQYENSNVNISSLITSRICYKYLSNNKINI